MRSPWLGLILTVLLVAGRAQAAVREEFVPPAATDPAIDAWLEPHLAAFDPTVNHRGQLYVHFPGTADVPDNSELICDEAAALGYHVISLRYPNEPSVDALASESTDPNVHEEVRRERLYGEDDSPLVNVTPANSVENRLVKLLEYLAAKHPGEGWDQFLDQGQPVWNRLALGGHSQGSGQAALLAKDHVVDRVLMFAGPADQVGGVSAAPWVSQPGATPLGRFFEFDHERDFLGANIKLDLAALGFNNRWSPVNVDDAVLNAGQHWLTTNYPVGTGTGAGLKAHNLVVIDGQTPRDEFGAPLFDNVWQHMLTSPVTLDGDANDDGAVDLSDFGLIKTNFGLPATWATGDFDGNGAVDLSDFGVLKSSFGQQGAASVPEPRAWVLLGLGVVFLAARERRWRSTRTRG